MSILVVLRKRWRRKVRGKHQDLMSVALVLSFHLQEGRTITPVVNTQFSMHVFLEASEEAVRLAVLPRPFISNIGACKEMERRRTASEIPNPVNPLANANAGKGGVGHIITYPIV